MMPLLIFLWAAMLCLPTQAADWQRTIIFIYGQTQPGQDMFLRGGIDHQYAQDRLAINCNNSNFLCAIPIRYRNTLNPYTANWKQGDSLLDWYGPEAAQVMGNQSGRAQGSVPDWTTGNANNSAQVASVGFGFTPLNIWGDHYWMLDVDMDCAKTIDGWFEVKSFISNASGWENDISQADAPYPSKNHFAKCGKINQFQRNSSMALFQDINNGDITTTTAAEKVFFQVDRVDGYINLFVNGIERMRFNNMRARVGEKIDITSLLWQGTNTIKVVASAIYDTDGYALKLWADDKLLLNSTQPQNFSQGIAFEQSLKVSIAKALPGRIVSINPATTDETAIYINNVFTGKFAPADIELAAGEYRLGLGESTRIPDSANSVAMTGQFREQDIVVGQQNITVNAAQIPPLNRVSEHRVAVVPLMLLHSGFSNEQLINSGFTLEAPASDIGVLTADDIIVAEKVIQLTGDKWIAPMSYGLTRWKLKVLAPVTQKIYFTDHLRLEDNIQFSDDLSKYDMVIFIMPDRTRGDAQGQRHAIKSGFGGLGVRPNAYLPASWLDGPGKSLSERLNSLVASSGMAHEALHVYGGYTRNDYPGVSDLHGSVFHGYEMHDMGFSPEWLNWQEKYIRSQVAEDRSTGLGIVSAQKPEAPSVYVGLFNIMHSGLGVEQLWSYRKPISNIKNLGLPLCLDLNPGRSAMIAANCNSNSSQRWSLRHAQNGAYSLVNDSSQNCIEFNQGQPLQQTCSYSLSQRFLLDPQPKDSVQIKTLTGECLALPPAGGNATAGTIRLETCNPTQTQQLWKLN